MIQKFVSRTPSSFATGDDFIQFGDLRNNSIPHCFHSQAARPSVRRSGASPGQVAKTKHQQASPALGQSGHTRQGSPRLDHALEALQRSRIGQVKVFEHLGGTPLSWRMPIHLRLVHAVNGRGQCLLQLLKMGVLQAVLAFWPASGRMMRDIKPLNFITGRMP